MPLPSLAVWLVVLLIGLPAMLRNWTAVALVASWLIGVTWKQATGEGAPLQLNIIQDYFVLIVIFLKNGKHCEPAPGALGWAKDCWLHLSRWDKAVVSLFLPVWIAYALTMNPWTAYWILWTAGILQFFCAGAEAIEQWRRGRAQVEADHPTDPPLSRQGLKAYEC